MTIPPVVRAAWVARTVDEAFAVFTEQIGAWWPLPTHGLFGDRSGSVVFREGQLVERSVDGNESVWAEVRAWDPPTRLVLGWHPGRGAEDASEVVVTFEADDHGTRVVIEHRGWEHFGDDALIRRLGYVGPNAWGYVLDHFGSVGEVRPDPADLTGLEEAYSRFFEEAQEDGFGAAPPGEWNAHQTLAHVALNDAAMLAVIQGIVHGSVPRFENDVCHDPAALDRWIDSTTDIAGLIAQGREIAMLVVTSLARLSRDQLDTEVHCRLSHDGEVVLDQPMPWHVVAIGTQAARHLPAHIEQLQNLRG